MDPTFGEEFMRDKDGRKKLKADSDFFRDVDGKVLFDPDRVLRKQDKPSPAKRIKEQSERTSKTLAAMFSGGGFNFNNVSQMARGDRAIEIQQEILEVAKLNLTANRQSATLASTIGATP